MISIVKSLNYNVFFQINSTKNRSSRRFKRFPFGRMFVPVLGTSPTVKRLKALADGCSFFGAAKKETAARKPLEKFGSFEVMRFEVMGFAHCIATVELF